MSRSAVFDTATIANQKSEATRLLVSPTFNYYTAALANASVLPSFADAHKNDPADLLTMLFTFLTILLFARPAGIVDNADTSHSPINSFHKFATVAVSGFAARLN